MIGVSKVASKELHSTFQRWNSGKSMNKPEQNPISKEQLLIRGRGSLNTGRSWRLHIFFLLSAEGNARCRQYILWAPYLSVHDPYYKHNERADFTIFQVRSSIQRSCLTEIYCQRASFSAGEVICLLPYTYDINIPVSSTWLSLRGVWIYYIYDRSNMHVREEANVVFTFFVSHRGNSSAHLWRDLGRALPPTESLKNHM